MTEIGDDVSAQCVTDPDPRLRSVLGTSTESRDRATARTSSPMAAQHQRQPPVERWRASSRCACAMSSPAMAVPAVWCGAVSSPAAAAVRVVVGLSAGRRGSGGSGRVGRLPVPTSCESLPAQKRAATPTGRRTGEQRRKPTMGGSSNASHRMHAHAYCSWSMWLAQGDPARLTGPVGLSVDATDVPFRSIRGRGFAQPPR